MNDMNVKMMEDLDEARDVFCRLYSLRLDIDRAAYRLVGTLSAGGRVFYCGNGGSAAEAQHQASELTGRFRRDRRPLSALALTTDTSALTAIGNDFGFERVFARQLGALARFGDSLVAISTSGQSPNVLRAIETARDVGMSVIGLLGCDGGAIVNRCDVAIIVPSWTTARIQEVHTFIGHVLCAEIERRLGLA